VLSGQEDFGDDLVLYSMDVEQGSGVVELDDNPNNYVNAVFTPNGKEIVYTAVTGNNKDDFEVLQVPVNGKELPEVLYSDAVLVDVRWSELVREGWSNYSLSYFMGLMNR